MKKHLKLLWLTPLVWLLALCGCAKKPITGNPPPVNLDHAITLTWSQSFANNGACSTTVTTSCISGFTEGYITGTSTQNQLHTDTTSICTGTTQPEACSSQFNSILPIGTVTFYVLTDYIDQNGTAGTVGPTLSASQVVAADAATNLTAVVK